VAAKKKKCVCCKSKPVWSRGLCPACHSDARRKIEAGEQSWETLIQQGLALPKYQTVMTRRLAEAK
jgi:hypothetical protein